MNPPIRSGVTKLSAVTRVLLSTASVSSSPPGRTRSRVSAEGLDVVLLVKLSPGDQVTFDPIAIGTGERVSAGRSCCTLPSVRLCRRLPPIVSVAHESRFE